MSEKVCGVFTSTDPKHVVSQLAQIASRLYVCVRVCVYIERNELKGLLPHCCEPACAGQQVDNVCIYVYTYKDTCIQTYIHIYMCMLPLKAWSSIIIGKAVNTLFIP